MKTRVQKWGNSLALRIPKSFATDVGLCEDCQVDISLSKGKLIIQPVISEPFTLEKLLEGITEDNLHGEWDTGPIVGREAW